MYTLLKSHFVRSELEKRNIGIFTPTEFQAIFSLNKTQAKHFLSVFVRQKFLIRLKRGLYALSASNISEQEIANRLYQPSYLSLEYVLHQKGELPEAPYEITSVTTKPTRRFEVDGKIFSYTTIQKSKYGNYAVERIDGRPILIAPIAKARQEYEYLRSLGRRGNYVGSR
jgi:predicted transcriptional regulator of viral defense system